MDQPPPTGPTPLNTARHTDRTKWNGKPAGIIYRQQYARCGKAGCRRCPPAGPGHGPYWYGYYWTYRQRTKSFYVGKTLPPGVEVLPVTSPAELSAEGTQGTEAAPIPNG